MPIRVALGQLRRIVVAIDPSVTSGEDSDDTGIIVVARGPHQPETCKFEQRCPGHGYVLGDFTCHLPPSGWAARALQAFDQFDADRIVAEVNNGGDMVGETIHAVRLGVPYEPVRASRGKLTRAEPAAALYEQGRIHHLGSFPELEDQMTNWTGEGNSPDRMDALVWGIWALGLIGAQGAAFLAAWQDELAEIEKHPADADTHSGGMAKPGLNRGDPASGLHFVDYEAPKYQVKCPAHPSGRHRFFGGSEKTCTQCGCPAPVMVVQ